MGDESVRAEEALVELAEECLALGKEERPEKRWLRDVYDQFREKNGKLGKAEADRLLYRRIYGRSPQRPSDTLKIRYWRTGRHLPIDRNQCLAFGKALELSEEEVRFLIQGYCDRCDAVFETGETGAVYRERRALLEELSREYMNKVHPAVRNQFYHSGAKFERNLRHLYYTDAKSYLDPSKAGQVEVRQHILSINYMSEFGRQMKLLGEIPRRAMIRHLLIFGSPFLNRELLSRRLEMLGYLGLDERHTQVDGSRLDRLLLGFLDLYASCCTGRDPEACGRWIRKAYGRLDEYLAQGGHASLRFFYFKAMKETL